MWSCFFFCVSFDPSMPGGAIYLMRKRAIEKQHRKKKAGWIRLNWGFLQIGDPQNHGFLWSISFRWTKMVTSVPIASCVWIRMVIYWNQTLLTLWRCCPLLTRFYCFTIDHSFSGCHIMIDWLTCWQLNVQHSILRACHHKCPQVLTSAHKCPRAFLNGFLDSGIFSSQM